MPKTRLNTDLDNIPLQCFTPEPDFVEVTADTELDINSYSVICFDQEADIFFNDDDSVVYSEWPAHQTLQVNKRVQSITFSIDGTLMYML